MHEQEIDHISAGKLTHKEVISNNKIKHSLLIINHGFSLSSGLTSQLTIVIYLLKKRSSVPFSASLHTKQFSVPFQHVFRKKNEVKLRMKALSLVDQLASLHSAPLRCLIPLSLDETLMGMSRLFHSRQVVEQTVFGLFGNSLKRRIFQIIPYHAIECSFSALCDSASCTYISLSNDIFEQLTPGVKIKTTTLF